jgi:hypothetical protein
LTQYRITHIIRTPGTNCFISDINYSIKYAWLFPEINIKWSSKVLYLSRYLRTAGSYTPVLHWDSLIKLNNCKLRTNNFLKTGWFQFLSFLINFPYLYSNIPWSSACVVSIPVSLKLQGFSLLHVLSIVLLALSSQEFSNFTSKLMKIIEIEITALSGHIFIM